MRFLKHFISSSSSCYCVLNFSCQETGTSSFLFPIFSSAQFLILMPNTAFYSNCTLSLLMLFASPRAKLQLPFHTCADMESMSVHWITQTKSVIVQEQLSKKIKVNGPGHRPSTEAFNHLSNTFTVQGISPEPGVKQCLKQILALKIQCLAQDFHKYWRTELMSSCRHLPCCQTSLTQFPQLWFENLLGVVLQMAAYLLQLLSSAMKPFGCLQGAWEDPSSSVLHKCVEHIKEITDSVSLSSPSFNSTCELHCHRAFP